MVRWTFLMYTQQLISGSQIRRELRVVRSTGQVSCPPPGSVFSPGLLCLPPTGFTHQLPSSAFSHPLAG